jgi:hypothetical protein
MLMPTPRMSRSLAGAAPPGDSRRIPLTFRPSIKTSLGALTEMGASATSGRSVSQMTAAVARDTRGQSRWVMAQTVVSRSRLKVNAPSADHQVFRSRDDQRRQVDRCVGSELGGAVVCGGKCFVDFDVATERRSADFVGIEKVGRHRHACELSAETGSTLVLPRPSWSGSPGARGGVLAGNSSVNRLPSPTLLSTRMRPPCSSRVF